MFMDTRINWWVEPHQYINICWKIIIFFFLMKSSDKKKEMEIPELKKNITSSHCKNFIYLSFWLIFFLNDLVQETKTKEFKEESGKKENLIKKESNTNNININQNLSIKRTNFYFFYLLPDKEYIPKAVIPKNEKPTAVRDRSQSELVNNFTPKGLNAKNQPPKEKEKDCRIFFFFKNSSNLSIIGIF